MDIRIATAADIPHLTGLLASLFAQEAEFHPDANRQAAGLAMIIADSRIGHVLVARLRPDDGIIAMAVVLYTVSTFLGARVCWLEDVVVDAGCRGQGIGARLVDAAIAHAQGHGCQRVTLLTDRDNERAQRLYRHAGFAPSPMLPMRRPIPLA